MLGLNTLVADIVTANVFGELKSSFEIEMAFGFES